MQGISAAAYELEKGVSAVRKGRDTLGDRPPGVQARAYESIPRRACGYLRVAQHVGLRRKAVSQNTAFSLSICRAQFSHTVRAARRE